MQTPRYTDVTRSGNKRISNEFDDQLTNPASMDNSQEKAPGHGSYGALLFDPKWKSKRAEIINRDQARCVICKSADELLVHHRQYHFVKAEQAFKMPWDYPGHLLITLCQNCHQRGHSKFKVPTLFI
ncbi:HNH endonuclease [Mucilaginibacter rubeus]|uniref:HNH endonuclease n=1 Tax=Mucilaginibacter rubeus TaxID=2027860 RepID=UPI001E628357|nr:hypothetical protein [Mucilaginibacter rubeus]